MTLHRARTHPQYVEGCFGCKVGGVGYDGKHMTKATTDDMKNTTTEHRDGRQDVLIRAPHIVMQTYAKEER